MNEHQLKDLTSMLNKCVFPTSSTDEVEDRIKYFVRRMKALGTDNIQSGGLYTRKDEFGGIEAGILIPIVFFEEEKNNEQ